MKKISKISEWKAEFYKHKHLILVSMLFLGIALYLNYVAGDYVDESNTVIAADLILDQIPPIDLTYIYIYAYGAIIATLFIYPLLFDIKRFHIVISQFSLLVMIRSFFITLTHLKAPADAIAVNISHLNTFLIFQNDLFFSGHTAIPLLGYFMFRSEKNSISWFFLAASIIMAVTVILMHIHYSIDVFAAFFIAYGSYRLGGWFFSKINSY